MLWDVNDRRGTLTSHQRVRTFLQSLVSAEKLVIRARDFENHPFDITFRLIDVRPAVEQVLRTCAGYAAQILNSGPVRNRDVVKLRNLYRLLTL